MTAASGFVSLLRCSDARATALLIDFPKKKFELPGGRVMIQRGSHGRNKIIDISHPGKALLASVRLLAQP